MKRCPVLFAMAILAITTLYSFIPVVQAGPLLPTLTLLQTAPTGNTDVKPVKNVTWGQVKAIYRSNSQEPNNPQNSTSTSRMVKPGGTQKAVAPYFPGWQMVRPSAVEQFGPWWDRDWKITFYIPNRTTKPQYIDVAACNRSGTWLIYDNYLDVYAPGPVGSSYKISYIFGGWKAVAFNIDMRAENWALYYR